MYLTTRCKLMWVTHELNACEYDVDLLCNKSVCIWTGVRPFIDYWLSCILSFTRGEIKCPGNKSSHHDWPGKSKKPCIVSRKEKEDKGDCLCCVQIALANNKVIELVALGWWLKANINLFCRKSVTAFVGLALPNQ